MKKFLAALTAVTIAAGLSLAAFVGPANAATTPTPTPTPSPTSTSTATPTSAPTVSDFTKNAAATAVVLKTTYETIVWSMAPGFNGTSATYPQVGIAQFKNETTENLNVNFASLEKCGVSYQVDVYVQTDSTTNNTAALDALYASGLAGPDGAQDGSFLAGANSNPGAWGLGYAWKFVTAAACQCLPDSNVSYTYSHDDTNSGDITVTNPNPAVYSNTLCTPFYVTAASWKYTGNATWPQVIDNVDKLGEITTASTTPYHYAAQVTCGQGDIYASTDATNTSLNPGTPGYLVGPGNPIAETFLSGMRSNPTDFTATTWQSDTWIQDANSCWTTPTPTDTVASCTVPGGVNSLTLPPVPGGIWSYTVNGNKTTLASGAGLAGFTPTVFGQYKITLTQDTTQSVFTVPYGVWYWTPVDATKCLVVPVTPTATPITVCDVPTGSVTITPTAGVNYFVGATQVTDGTSWVDQAATTGLTGKVTVTAVAQTGFAFGANQTASWTFKLGHEKDCTITFTTGDCIPTNGVSNESVTVTVENPGKQQAVVDVTGPGITGALTFDVPAGQTVQQIINATGSNGDVYNVSINGIAQPPYDLTITDCLITVHPADPTVVDTTCTGTPSTFVGGSITTDGNPNLTYTLTGGSLPAGGEVFPDATAAGGPTISNLPGGQYLVSVASNNPNYILGPATPTAYPVTIDLTSRTCSTTLTPVVTADATCTDTGLGDPVQPTDPQQQIKNAPAVLHAATTYLDGGVIDLPQQPGILVFKINGVEQDGAAVNEPNGGPYVVTVELTAQAVTDGYVLSDPSVSWSYSFSTICPLPTLASFNAGVTGTNATCTATSAVDGVLDLVHAANQAGDVTYTVTNDATSKVVYTGSGSNNADGDYLLNVVPGTYTVVATPPAGDGISGNPDATAYETFAPITIAEDGTDCDGTLAFTGGTIAWFGFILAGGMLFLGFALFFMRRRGNRTAD